MYLFIGNIFGLSLTFLLVFLVRSVLNLFVYREYFRTFTDISASVSSQVSAKFICL